MKRFFKIIISIVVILVTALILIMIFVDHKKLKIVENKSEELYEPEITTMNFPLMISVHDIEKLANSKIKEVLIDKRIPQKKGDTLILKITRMGNIKFVLSNLQFNSSVPLKLEVQYIKKIVGKKSVEFFKKEPLVLMLSAKFRSKVNLDEYMKLRTETTLTEIQWNEEPNIRFLGIEFKLKEKINELLFAKAPEITSNIDGMIREKVNLIKPTLKIWKNIQKSIKTNKKQKDLFIRIQPQTLSVHVDKSLGDSLKLDLIVTSKVYVRFGADTSLIAKVDLPKKIKIVGKNKVEDVSKIQLHFLFPLKKLNEIIQKELVGKTFKVQNLNVTIKKVQVINGTKNIYVRIKHTGDIKGQVLLKGMPKLSKDKQSINIENVAFENQIEDEVVNSLTDLLHAEILSLLQEYVHFDIAEVMESIPDYARTAIKKSKMAKKAQVNLDHLEVDDLEIELTKDNIQLLVSGHSTFEISLKKESFKLKK